MSEFGLSFAQCLLGPLPFGDVVVGLQDRGGSLLLVPLQRPSARHHDLRPVALGVCQLSFPASRPEQFLIDFFERRGEDRLRELVSRPARWPPLFSSRIALRRPDSSR